MSTPPNPLTTARNFGALRAADSFLRALGGTQISLRIPSPVSNPGTASEIGLAAPLYQDVALAPAVVRALINSKPTIAQARFEFLISATAVQQQMLLNNFSSAADFFSSALGIVYNSDLLRIEQLASDDFAGAPYLYRVTCWLPA